MSDVKLGVLPDAKEQKDAIHIAIAPVIAGHDLKPGQHVGFEYDGRGTRVVAMASKSIGVVDPFLKDVVLKGERFWMLLYPQTITSLRHDWAHPAFADESIELTGSARCLQKEDSIQWLRELADEIGISEDYLMRGIASGRVHTGDREMYDIRSSEDIKRHYENATGEKCSDAVYFSCAC